jgi:hypothetical protein
VGCDGRVVAAGGSNADQDLPSGEATVLVVLEHEGARVNPARRKPMEQDVLRYDRIDPALAACVDELLGRMTLAEKAGQLVQVTTPQQDVLCEEFANDA